MQYKNHLAVTVDKINLKRKSLLRHPEVEEKVECRKVDRPPMFAFRIVSRWKKNNKDEHIWYNYSYIIGERGTCFWGSFSFPVTSVRVKEGTVAVFSSLPHFWGLIILIATYTKITMLLNKWNMQLIQLHFIHVTITVILQYCNKWNILYRS